MESITRQIREIIEKKKTSVNQIAKYLGVARESLYRSLKDDGNPEWKRIRQILDYLDYEVVLKPKGKEVKEKKPESSNPR